MGLDFSHCDARWGYGGFDRFRQRLAKEIGINLHKMEGFSDRGFSEPGSISWDTVTDPLKEFLNHSDCDGHLTPDQCRVIAPRLREIVSGWDCDDYDRVNALELVEGMMIAANKEELLLFC